MLEKLDKVFTLDDFWSMNRKLALANVKMEIIEDYIYLAWEMCFSVFNIFSAVRHGRIRMPKCSNSRRTHLRLFMPQGDKP
jgi:hypothetical protein